MTPHERQRLDYYVLRWGLEPTSAPFSTKTSILQACTYQDRKAMLKLPTVEEERRGSYLMRWWDGNGAATVYCHSEDALLLERIENAAELTLKGLVGSGQDDLATRIICSVAQQLHQPRLTSRPPLITLDEWFEPFISQPNHSTQELQISAEVARYVLKKQKEVTVLHGDLHHANILYGDRAGWKAIDPKGLYGDRAFDFANILCNPTADTALSEGRLARQLDIICQEANISKRHMVDWLVAWSGLSTYWLAEDNADTILALALVADAIHLRTASYLD